MSLLWFQRRYVLTPELVLDYITFLKSRLPDYACKFLEICLMVSADHGPAVSGAHNTIVTARAGKDLVSSLTSGLLTIVSICHLHPIECVIAILFVSQTGGQVWWSP